MNQSPLQAQNKPCLSRRMLRFIFAIMGLVILLYSGAWFVFGTMLHHYVDDELRALNGGQQFVTCENLHKTGYPLRIALVCDRIDWQDRANGFRATVGKVTAGAPIYAPAWRSLGVHSPGYVEWAEFGSIEAIWNHFTMSANFIANTPHDFVMMIEDLQLNWRKSKSEQEQAKAISSKADFVRLQGKYPEVDVDTPLDVHLTFDKLYLPLPDTIASGPIPALDGQVEIRLNTPLPLAHQTNWPEILRGRSGQVKKIDVLFSSGGGVRIEGDFHFSPTGEVSAELMLSLRETAALQRTLPSLFPEQSSNLASLIFALGAMPKNNAGEPVIPIRIDRGEVRAGFIPLGTLPPL